MKKKKLILKILFILLLLPVLASAQTWPMPGARWTYCYDGIGDIYEFLYRKDTIINDIIYQKIEHISDSAGPNLGWIFTRYNNDTVYRFVNSRDYQFLIFNDNVGDVYTSFRSNPSELSDSACSSILPLKVVEIDSMIIGSVILKKWSLVDTLFDDIYNMIVNYPNPNWNVVERIGFLNDFPFLPGLFIGNNCTIGTDAEYSLRLYSYSDYSFNYNTYPDCYYAIGLEEKNANFGFTIFPNPVKDIINISSQNISDFHELIIINLMGLTMYQQTINYSHFTVSVSNFPSGFYFLKFINNNTGQNISIPVIVIN